MKLKRLLSLLWLLIFLASCGSSKKTKYFSADSGAPLTEEGNRGRTKNSLALDISENAKAFLGTKYKYGGTTKKGMDCSGLIYTAFLQENISIPRVSREMSLQGKRLYLREVGTGDLLFFETNKNRKVINHVGLVVERKEEDIFFIHSTSSRGVIISSLKNPYWQEHFVMARRIL